MKLNTKEDLINEAKSFIQIGDYNFAINILDQLTLEFPNDVECIFYKGVAYHNASDFKNAILNYNLILNLEKDRSTYLNKGLALIKLKKYNYAIENYKEALLIFKKDADLYCSIGLAHYNNGEHLEALNNYNISISLNPNNINALGNRGIVNHELKKYEKAIHDYNEVTRLDKNDIKAYINKALVFINIKKYEKAIENIDTAIELDPNRALLFIERGSINAKIGEIDNAFNDLNKAIELNDNDPNTNLEIEKVKIEIHESRLNNSNPLRKEIHELSQDIKDELIFKGAQICHYTALEVLQLLIDKEVKSKLRFSHINLLNDATEGVVFYNYLFDEENLISLEKENRASFIGSFVESNNNNNLSMWRAYGKDAQGVSICLDKNIFQVSKKQIDEELQIEQEEKELIKEEQLYKDTNQTKLKLSTLLDRNLYHVAYLDKEKNKVFVKEEENEEILSKLKQIQIILDKNPNDNTIKQPLERIKFLFKDAIFKDERELRFFEVLPHDSKLIKWDTNFNPPRTFIELNSDISHSIENITVGPKAENASGWIAYFETQLASQGNKDVEISQSKIPYR